MLIFGDARIAGYWYNQEPENRCVLNFTSLMGCKYTLSSLNPYTIHNEIPYEDYQFDVWYKNYIEQNPAPFKELISLMRLVYNGVDVYVMIDPSLVVGQEVVESLIKYINEIYGYSSNVVYAPEDLDDLVEGTFSMQGIELFDSQMDYCDEQYGTQGLQFSEGPYNIKAFNVPQPRGGLNEFI